MKDNLSFGQSMPRDESFSEYYVMMLSVIHGLVLGGAAYGLSSLVVLPSGTRFTFILWSLLRWTTSFMFAVTSAWKYIVGAAYLKWKLDPFDVAIPSLIGLTLTAAFVVIDTPTAWLWITISFGLFGVLAGLNALLKQKKPVIDDKREYGRNLWFNLLGGISIAIVFVVLWFILSRAIMVQVATVVLFIFSLLQLGGEFRLWRTLKGAWKI